MAGFQGVCVVFGLLVLVPSIFCQSNSTDDGGLLLDVSFDNTTGLQDRVCGLQPTTLKDSPEMITVDAKKKKPHFQFGYSVTSSSPLAAYQFFPLNTGITICFYLINFFNETAAKDGTTTSSGILRVNFGDRWTYLSLWTDNSKSTNPINYILAKNGDIINSGTLRTNFNDWGYKCIALSRLQIHVAGYHKSGFSSTGQNEVFKLSTPFEPDYSGFEVRIGEAVTDKGLLVYMNKGDAIACLSVYDSALDDAIRVASNTYAPIRNCSLPPVNVSTSTSCSQRKVVPEKIVRNSTTKNNKPVAWDTYVPPGMQGISGTTVNSKLETTTSSSNRLSSSTIAAFLVTLTSYFTLF